jgi:hypothetical protein
MFQIMFVSMAGMFVGAGSFNQDLCDWDDKVDWLVIEVTDTYV